MLTQQTREQTASGTRHSPRWRRGRRTAAESGIACRRSSSGRRGCRGASSPTSRGRSASSGSRSLYWPCEALGGDLYDLVWRRDCAVLLVADVMGHGVEAALITHAREGGLPGDRGDDRRAGRGAPADERASASDAAPARLRRRRRRRGWSCEGPDIRLANAGLPHPFLLHASDRQRGRAAAGRPPPRPPRRPVAKVLYRVGRAAASSRATCSSSPPTGSAASRARAASASRTAGCSEVLAELTGQEGRERRSIAWPPRRSTFGRGRPLPDDINLVAVSRNGREAWPPSDELTRRVSRGVRSDVHSVQT